MRKEDISSDLLMTIRKAQKDEVTGSIIYGFMSKHEKDEKNKQILKQMSEDEQKHAEVWKSITEETIKPSSLEILMLKFFTLVLGFTFVVKKMQKGEQVSEEMYVEMQQELPQTADILKDERRHEKELYAMLDEERLHYLGAIVLGLNDALVELTGAIAGVTFALANNQIIALTGIVTGISATLSMAASNYLAQRAEGNKDAIKSSAYTGIAYLITVVLLVLPYLLLPSTQYVLAFTFMILTVVIIIFFFNYYISVAKDEPFFRRFLEMVVISLSVALISFLIGTVAKNVFGIDVA
ncbi:VIT1/CCC1 transporter family protein [Breznakia pachnodae]|uniref:VIT1/CCC1 family predicted Fe2+/Mn2+ transporter n=1 Tax=Breznakia pachnodae TaxID=265178 RepID=A0ABU0E4F4_9FIRM|nr:VIT1/CCC1 family protein [Breznakia pachnodae]MDQ0361765.1 VIT1/CCC1 family predicted Fe2+/Mn2+ transporter [Breznakia pachnodae]